MKLIEKSAIVAEIERRIEKLTPMVCFGTTVKGVNMQLAREELQKVLCFLDALEVIEFDYEKELEKYWHPFITAQDLIKKYVSDHAANRWLNASEVEQLLNDFVLDYDIIKNREYEQQCKCKSK